MIMGRKKIYATEQERKQAQFKQRNQWTKDHRTAFTFRFNNDTQYDVISHLKATPNKSEYIVKLIRKDIEK